MAAGPAFTVVMPAFNAERTIAASIRSILGQTRDDFELIVVNDGSTDGTADVARRFTDDPRVRVLDQENGGPGAARNHGIAAGSAPYVSLLDSDDLWLPTYLEAMGAALDAAPAAGFAYTDAWVLDDASGRIGKKTAMAYQDPPMPPPDDPHDFLRLLLTRRNFVFTSTTLRRSALEDAGPFIVPATPSGAEDYELWLRIVAHGYRAIRVPGTLAIYRKHQGSLSTDAVALLRGEREAVRLVAEEYDVPDDIRTVARRQVRKLDRRLAGLGDGGGTSALLPRAHARAVRAKLAFADRFGWYRQPPPDVARVLATADRGD